MCTSFHRVVHFEITVNDPARAKKFYTDIFGWKIERWKDSEYYLVSTGATGTPGIDGGLLKRTKTNDRIINTIQVESIGDYMKKVKEGGGTLTTDKIDMEEVGSMVYAQDPEGNDFGMIQFSENSLKKMRLKLAALHTISWFELPATDLSRAKQFYEKVFEIKMPTEEMGPGMKMAIFPAEGMGVHGALIQSEGYIPSQQGAMVYLNGGPDLSKPLSKVTAAGGKILKDKFGIGKFGYIAFFLDSEGNRVALHSME